MRKTLLVLTGVALALVACSSPSDETTGKTTEAYGVIIPQPYLGNPPPPPSYVRATEEFVFMPTAACPDIPVPEGTLRGKTGADWMSGWGKDSPWAYYQGVFQDVRDENPHLDGFMVAGWTPFCVYWIDRTGAPAGTHEVPHLVDLWALQAAGGTNMTMAYTPSWFKYCPTWHAPCPVEPCLCEPEQQ